MRHHPELPTRTLAQNAREELPRFLSREREALAGAETQRFQTRRPGGAWRVVRFCFGFAATTVVVAGAWLSLILLYYTAKYPDPFAIAKAPTETSVQIYAYDGTLISKRGDARPYISLNLLPQHVVDAIIATEDRRFYEHWGIDPTGLMRAAYTNLRAGRTVQGGSTLTQQLAKNLFLTPERTITRKLEELALAIWLECRLTKLQILELYLNRVYFGGGAFGIEAAAQRFFAKSAGALTLPEAAIVAGLLKAPSKLTPTRNPRAARERGHLVIQNMADAGFLTWQEATAAKGSIVAFNLSRVNANALAAGYATDLVLERLKPFLSLKKDALIVETTLDAKLQGRATRIVRNRIDREGIALGAEQAALITLDKDGGIRALVGGVDYATSQFNRATKAKRQPGSAFKPFVFLAALEAGHGPNHTAYDLPITINGWTPKNANGRHVGAVSLKRALADSINTVAVQLSVDVGLDKVEHTARRLGITSPMRVDPSLALGTSELSLYELVAAYAVLASGGHERKPYIIRRIRDRSGNVLFAQPATQNRSVVSKSNVSDIDEMLRAVLIDGTGRRAVLNNYAAAGKTGTSQDFRDAWFIGYTPHLTTGIWIGNDRGTPMKNISGGGLPAEIWRDVMIAAHGGVSKDGMPVTRPPQIARQIAPPAPDRNPVRNVVQANMPTRMHPKNSIDEDFIASVINDQNNGGAKSNDPATAVEPSKFSIQSIRDRLNGVLFATGPDKSRFTDPMALGANKSASGRTAEPKGDYKFSPAP